MAKIKELIRDYDMHNLTYYCKIYEKNIIVCLLSVEQLFRLESLNILLTAKPYIFQIFFSETSNEVSAKIN